MSCFLFPIRNLQQQPSVGCNLQFFWSSHFHQASQEQPPQEPLAASVSSTLHSLTNQAILLSPGRTLQTTSLLRQSGTSFTGFSPRGPSISSLGPLLPAHRFWLQSPFSVFSSLEDGSCFLLSLISALTQYPPFALSAFQHMYNKFPILITNMVSGFLLQTLPMQYLSGAFSWSTFFPWVIFTQSHLYAQDAYPTSCL